MSKLHEAAQLKFSTGGESGTLDVTILVPTSEKHAVPPPEIRNIRPHVRVEVCWCGQCGLNPSGCPGAVTGG